MDGGENESSESLIGNICHLTASCHMKDDTESISSNKLFDEEFLSCSYEYLNSENESDYSSNSTDPYDEKLYQPTYFHKSYSLPSSYRIGDISNIPKQNNDPRIYITSSEGKHLTKKLNINSKAEQKVHPQNFQERLKKVVSWFEEFDSSQKNAVLSEILALSDAAAQNHLISVKLKDRLHKHCPPNCEDIISWLPVNISLFIFGCLDPISLCACAQVCRAWRNLANEPSLWRKFCTIPKWGLSKQGEKKQLEDCRLPSGLINWKKAFAARFRLRRNWLKGCCHVRTFEGHSQGISCVQFDGSRIVSGSSDKTIKVWKLRTNCQWSVMTLVGHAGTVRCLHLAGNRLVSGSTDTLIKVWDLSEDKTWLGMSCKVTMIGHTETVRCLQVHSNRVVSGSYDKTLKVWDLKSGDCLLTLRGHAAAVLCVQFDDVKIVSGSSDKTIKVWHLNSGTCIQSLCGHEDAVTCLTYDSSKIISGSLDRTIKFWDLISGTCLSTLDWMKSEGHTGVIRCLQADNWRIVSAGDDKTIKVWNSVGQRLVTLQNHTDGVTCLQFNDSMIISGSYDKTVKLWDFSVC